MTPATSPVKFRYAERRGKSPVGIDDYAPRFSLAEHACHTVMANRHGASCPTACAALTGAFHCLAALEARGQEPGHAVSMRLPA